MSHKTSKVISVLIVLSSLISTQSGASGSNENTENGIITIKSSHTVSETINKLENVLNKKGMTIFKRVNHTAGAEKAGLTLRPTELLIFGNPKVGTPLMSCSQTAALDLPQKALVYEDESGQVWLAYNDPAYMAQRHNIKGCEEAVKKVTNALAKFASVATE